MKEQNQKISLGFKTDICKEHGEYQAEVFELKIGEFSRKSQTWCPECEKIRIEEKKKEEAEEEKEKINRRVEYTNIPKRFLDCSFENYQTSKESNFNFKTISIFFKKFEELKEKGASMILCGKPGTGKTHLAAAGILSLAKSGKYVKYTTSYKLFAMIKATYSKYSDESDQEIIKRYTECELLVIDEVGVQFGSEAEKVLFYQIINGRYENVLPTILISNLNKDGVKDFIGDRCFDRLKEGGGAVLSFDWESHRK